LRRWVGFWKRLAGKKAVGLKRAFQDDFWDTQMRDHPHYDEKLHYVRMNPVRKGLVSDWREWPFQGQVFEVLWL
jgi:REP element-mobilizing transposase RayT